MRLAIIMIVYLKSFVMNRVFIFCVCERGTFLFSLVFFQFVLVGGCRVSGGVSESVCCVLLN